MIRYYVRENGRLKELQEPVPSCWIDISPPFTHEELEDIGSRFLIPIDFMTDSLDIDERPRYEKEDDVRLMVIHTPILNDGDREDEAIYITVPIGLIVTIDHVITITSFENPVINHFIDNKVKNFDPANDKLFVLQILEQNVYRFLNCLKKLNLRRNSIEKELYNSSRNQELKLLLSIEKSLVYFVNALSANELLKMKMKRTDFIQIREDEDMTDLLEDIIIDNRQALEMANIYTNILSGTMDSYSSIIANNLNMVIQRLTIITIVLMVPTLVSSFFGMNVSLPLHDNKYAFLLILIIAVILSLLIVWFFRRKQLF
jgi:magnesium transporter